MSDNASGIDLKPTIEMDGLKAFMVYHCPSCGKNRHAAGGLPPNTKVRCGCGKTVVSIEGDGLAGLQRGFDDLQRALKSLGTLKIRG